MPQIRTPDDKITLLRQKIAEEKKTIMADRKQYRNFFATKNRFEGMLLELSIITAWLDELFPDDEEPREAEND